MKKYMLLLITCLGWSLGACDKDFEAINKNPNRPEDIGNPGYLLPNIIRSVAVNNMNNSWEYGTVVADMMASSAGSNYNYRWIRSEVNKFSWNYYSYIKDLNDVIVFSDQQSLNNYKGIALILRTWMFQNITDLYGPIHFREASAALTQGIYLPSFESQQEVYAGMITDLEQALALLGTSNEPITGDILYAGQLSKWKKFATGMMLRLLTRQSDRISPAEKMREIIGNPGKYPLFASHAEQAALTFIADRKTNDAPYYHYAATAYQVRRITQNFIDSLQNLSDPRLHVFALPTPRSVSEGKHVYRGEVNGTGDFKDVSLSSPVGMLWAPMSFSNLASPTTGQSIFMTYSEVQFILAEAAEKGWIPGGSDAAAMYYKNGIRDQFEYYASRIPATYAQSYLSLHAADVIPDDSYYTQPLVRYEGSQADKLRKIWKQKWMAAFYVGFEAYSEWRRTGFPTLIPGPINAGYVPVRMVYPEEEIKLNATHYQEALRLLGGEDRHTTPVWWDVN